ncbi:MAG: heme-binding protein [Alphaproteobacteria bacterium]|nr:heme-binding protein [Alphaproteobacteria bacterium]MBU1515180.1 heme-binding protein [Alphaproteobacteria bacterium]MBU2092310.1 heme-binding protein [Alphaproteobacteria bacterium]MBU2152904.1 heme-binding protein [Alphaproteobacteria bacterium]MBU2305735.1 heme-binding protein [Alphaproteobacteria bacterium]
MRTKLSIGIFCGVLAFGAGAQAGPPPTNAYRYALPLDLALEAATEAVRVCGLNGYRVTATVVNMDGISQVVLRGDGATVHTGQSSYEKAFTVVTLGPEFNFDTSGALFELVKTNPYAPRLAQVTHVMALPGAVSIRAGNAIVAALGVGGAPGGDKDEVCARAGVAKIADRLPR